MKLFEFNLDNSENIIQMYHTMYHKYLNRFCLIVGFDLFTKDFKRNFLRNFVQAMIGILIITVLYTAIAYEDMDTKLQALSFLGIAVQGFYQMNQASNHLNDMQFSVIFVEDILKVNPFPFKKCLPASVIAIIVGAMSYCATGAFLLGWPVIMYLWTKEPQFMLPVFVPFVDEHSHYGYIFICIFHIVLVSIGVFGLMGLDLTFVIALISTWGLTEAFKRKLENLSNITRPFKGNTITDIEMKYFLRNQIMMHQEFRVYMTRLKNTYSDICSTQYCSTPATMVLILLIESQKFWPKGIFFFMSMFVRLLSYSIAGTWVEMMNERVYAAIISCCWYHFPVNEQKSVRIIIKGAQEFITYNIGGVYPVNLNTFVQVMKGIYSLTMLLGARA